MNNYSYIGKDGKQVLARDLEDQRDEALEELRKVTAERDEYIGLLVDIVNTYDEPDNGRYLRWSIDTARATLAKLEDRGSNIAQTPKDPLVPCPAKHSSRYGGFCGLCGTEEKVPASVAEEYLRNKG